MRFHFAFLCAILPLVYGSPLILPNENGDSDSLGNSLGVGKRDTSHDVSDVAGVLPVARNVDLTAEILLSSQKKRLDGKVLNAQDKRSPAKAKTTTISSKAKTTLSSTRTSSVAAATSLTTSSKPAATTTTKSSLAQTTSSVPVASASTLVTSSKSLSAIATSSSLSAGSSLQAPSGTSSLPASSTSSASGASCSLAQRDGIERRADDYGTLSVPAAPQTGTQLSTWASTVYGASPREVVLNLDEDSDYRPTSRFESFGTSSFYLTLKGLYGCTSVVVVSRCGAYVSHFWSPVIDDTAYKQDSAHNTFVAGAQKPLMGQDSTAEETAANQASTLPGAPTYELAPTDNWTPLSDHTSNCLNTANNVQAFIFAAGTAGGATNPTTTAALKSTIAQLTGLSQSKISTHTYTVNKSQATDTSQGNGKVLVSTRFPL